MLLHNSRAHVRRQLYYGWLATLNNLDALPVTIITTIHKPLGPFIRSLALLRTAVYTLTCRVERAQPHAQSLMVKNRR